ncbi:hypothetical protein DYB25_002724 [Aphanomyces astaci]|uniref:Uncharacterized protein n=1 Tax=Aphanomyces astaci TaxID=112090 RepID=A0A397BFW6_APHAT|nr:hypothetical protein DYB36_006645 [Aphanomyces astaci]RHY19623.1 hypothetical protein DYB25_002724 [Aphanomyces astaci]RHY42374.1 hypothetical protein DYB30_013354 [Aphanomyces astaci]RHY45202.1 hypothetical protein DYB38_006132 [Aphanomyces astaci]RHY54720.1 hypothetical protein DYB34_006052 [Aphanomyces astaci]
MATCFFRSCTAPVDDSTPNAWRCKFHRGRSRCLVHDCDNQAYARALCVRHGGKIVCRHPEGCQARARVGDFCPRHGATRAKVLCAQGGCTNVTQLRGRCVKHGGGRVCKWGGCSTFARQGGYCARHTRQIHKTHAAQVASSLCLEAPWTWAKQSHGQGGGVEGGCWITEDDTSSADDDDDNDGLLDSIDWGMYDTDEDDFFTSLSGPCQEQHVVRDRGDSFDGEILCLLLNL